MKCSLSFTILLLPLLLFGQGKYVKLEEITCESEQERRLLGDVLTTGDLSVKSFLAIATDDSAKYDKWSLHFDQQMQGLKSRKVKKKKAKDLNFIYEELHEIFLTKYEFVAYFDQIFETGVYNCVTAVALYALTFEELGIDYHIKETPTHVYLVADPDDSQLLIETTDPVNGFTGFSTNFKEQFVAQLVERKLVDRSDLSAGINKVFDEFYFQSNTITINELLGVQYYNRGLMLLEEKRYYEAWNTLAKGQLFYQSDALERMLFAALVNRLTTTDYSGAEDYEMLFFLPRFLDFNLKRSDVAAEYSRMLNDVLVTRGDEQLADSLFVAFASEVEDDEMLRGVTFEHNYQRSRLLFDRARYREAFDFASAAYEAKPENADAEKLMVWSLTLADFEGGEEEISVVIDSLLATYPDLSNNNHLLGFRLNVLLDRMSAYFERGAWDQGNQMKKLFEQAAGATPEADYNTYKVGDAYSAAAVYYFRRNRLQTARKVIEVGLQYAPDNMELKSRRYMINR